MDCTALLKRSEKQFVAGNVTLADAAVELADCLPQVCEQVFGFADFDLAGTGGVYRSQPRLYSAADLDHLFSLYWVLHTVRSVHLRIRASIRFAMPASPREYSRQTRRCEISSRQ